MSNLKSFVRPVEDADREKMTVVSYSRLDTLKQCPYRYFLHYEKHLSPKGSAIALDVGTFCHALLEERGIALAKGQTPLPLDKIKTTHEAEYLALQAQYWEDWTKKDKSGMDYNQKFSKFWEYLSNSLIDAHWHVGLCEHPFEFVFNDQVIVKGFIDRIDFDDDGNIKVTDYKTANHVYATDELNYSPQFFTYALAVLNEYGVLPQECEYDFVFLGQKAKALNCIGWERKCLLQLQNIVHTMFTLNETRKFMPSPSPLCYFCPYALSNPKGEAGVKDACDYYSLWTPTDRKNFKVKTKFDKEEFVADEAYAKHEKAVLRW